MSRQSCATLGRREVGDSAQFALAHVVRGQIVMGGESMNLTKQFRVEPGSTLELGAIDPDFHGGAQIRS